MATWKKVIVSGSSANLANLQVDSLSSGVVTGAGGNLTTTAVNGTGNIVATTGANGVSMSGSFSGSFSGSGAGLTGVTATAIFPTVAKTDLASTDQFFINDGTNKFVTYGNLLTDLAGTNLAVESTDSLTLAATITGITSISSTAFTGSLFGTASYATAALSSSFASTASFYGGSVATASFALTASSIGPAITNNTDNRVLTATGGGSINGEANLTFNGSTLQVTGDAIVSGDLTVNGTTTFINTTNLYVEDQLILIASGSNTLVDSGWVAQYNAAGSGSAFYVEAGSAGSTGTYGRFAVAYDVLGINTSINADEYMVTAKVNQASAPVADPTWGGSSTGMGNMWTTTTGDIYIYS
jgi:fibronectin-binding autotransporter adhesin